MILARKKNQSPPTRAAVSLNQHHGYSKLTFRWQNEWETTIPLLSQDSIGIESDDSSESAGRSFSTIDVESFICPRGTYKGFNTSRRSIGTLRTRVRREEETVRSLFDRSVTRFIGVLVKTVSVLEIIRLQELSRIKIPFFHNIPDTE